MKNSESPSGEKRAVSWWEDRLSGFTGRHQGFLRFLGNLESWVFKEDIAECGIDKPIYVSGLARAGTTILLELISAHPDIATHRYRDFPPVHIPVWWNWFLDRAKHGEPDPVERFHKDRILVTSESPEAMEEIIWMSYFPTCHDPCESNVLSAETSHPDFEKFYREHIRKLLFVRGGNRYVSKGNYNITRLQYLKKLFPDARFVIPVRDPVGHVASLMKQHRLFCDTEQRDGRILNHMRRVGHFEFGIDLRFINVGHPGLMDKIEDLLNDGQEVRAWACYWSAVYGFVADMLDSDKEVRQATIVISYEDLCRNPLENLALIYDHCQIAIDEESLQEQAGFLSLPSYYSSAFSENSMAVIKAETHRTVERIKQFER